VALPPIHLFGDHLVERGPNEKLPADDSVESQTAGIGSKPSNSEPPIEDVASKQPTVAPAENLSESGPLVFAAQLTEAGSSKTSTEGISTSPGTTPVPDSGHRAAAPNPAPIAAEGDGAASENEQAPAKESETALSLKQLNGNAGNLSGQKPDVGGTLTGMETPSKAMEPTSLQPRSGIQAPPAMSSDTNVQSKSEINTSANTPPAKEISLRVVVSDSTLDLKFTDSGGKVQVSVRSADTDLAHSIQAGVGDLVSQLERKGFETETWMPQDHAFATPATAESSAANNGSPDPQQHFDRGSQQQPGDGRQQSQGQGQGQGQGQRPKWFNEAEFGFSLDGSSGVNTK
jgi:hypothetical protein